MLASSAMHLLDTSLPLALQVEILSIGDHVNELYIVVGGMLETMKVDNNESLDEIALNMDSGSSMRGDTGGPNNHGARCAVLWKPGVPSGQQRWGHRPLRHRTALLLRAGPPSKWTLWLSTAHLALE